MVQQCIEAKFSQPNITRYVNATQWALRQLISNEVKENPEELLLNCKREIVKIAEDKKIPLRTFEKDLDSSARGNWFTRNALTINRLNKNEQMKESLRWVSCLAEFYSGDSLFKDNAKQISNEFKEIKQHQDEMELDYQRWLLGYFQCDLDK